MLRYFLTLRYVCVPKGHGQFDQEDHLLFQFEIQRKIFLQKYFGKLSENAVLQEVHWYFEVEIS